MKETLERDRLDVRGKSRSNLFNWRGQFTPEFIEYLLERFTPHVGVLDPFCGSGTVLVECARKGIPAAGIEINPAAYAMSKFFTFCNDPLKERGRLLDLLSEHLSKVLPEFEDLPLFNGGRGFRERHGNLLDFARDLFGLLTDKRLTLLALTLLFYAESSRNEHLGPTVEKAFCTLRHNLLSLPLALERIEAHLHDARRSDEALSFSVDLIITSPPYINVFNYHQNYRAILEVLGFDILKVAQSELGSNRKNRGNRFRTVIQYCLDMELALASFARTLSPKGKIIMVVGRESRIRGISFYNSQLVRELAEGMGCFEITGFHERAFTNRFGKKIREDILICEKTQTRLSTGNAREVATSHLEHSLAFAQHAVRHEIVDAISKCPHIDASPFFEVKEVI